MELGVSFRKIGINRNKFLILGTNLKLPVLIIIMLSKYRFFDFFGVIQFLTNTPNQGINSLAFRAKHDLIVKMAIKNKKIRELYRKLYNHLLN